MQKKIIRCINCEYISDIYANNDVTVVIGFERNQNDIGIEVVEMINVIREFYFPAIIYLDV